MYFGLYRYKSGFTPKAISNLKLWFDASSIKQSDNTSVESWDDLSGNNVKAEQTTLANKPTFKTNQINGKPALSFDGGDYLSLTSGLGSINNASGATVFCVVKFATGAIQVAFNIATTGTTTNNRLQVRMNGTNLFQNTTRRSDATGNLTTVSTGTINSSFKILSIVSDYVGNGINGTSTQYINNTADGTGNFSTSGNMTNSDSPFIFIGADNDSPATTYLNGLIAEIILYNKALNTNERNSIYNYLKTKYAL